MAPEGMGRFSQALRTPATILPRSKTSRRPSFFSRTTPASSTLSMVEKRRPQERHSRRRRMPSSSGRESVTRVLSALQKGQFIARSWALGAPLGPSRFRLLYRTSVAFLEPLAPPVLGRRILNLLLDVVLVKQPITLFCRKVVNSPSTRPAS